MGAINCVVMFGKTQKVCKKYGSDKLCSHVWENPKGLQKVFLS